MNANMSARNARSESEPDMSMCAGGGRGVCFASVQVREYFRILGDNPSVTSGPPISLSWEYDEDLSGRCSIDEWEGMRCHERRTRLQFRVPEEVRMDWVLDAGYSPDQVREVVGAIEKERRELMSSVVKSRLQDKADVVAEGVKKRLARAVGKREKSDALYTKWVSSVGQREKTKLLRRATA